MSRKARIWLSRKSACGSPRANCTKRLKDMAPSSMKTVPTHCTAGGKSMKDESRLPMPPVAMVEKLWVMASKPSIPAQR